MMKDDTTPDMYYPLRILRAYRADCHEKAQSLDKAITILEREM